MERTGTDANTVDVSLVAPSYAMEASGDRATMAVSADVRKDECVMSEVAQSLFDDLQSDLYRGLPPGYHMYYIFDEQGQPIPTENLAAMSDLLSHPEKRRVGKTTIRFRGMEVDVSTIFLVMNHDHSFSRFPVLWESMTFTSDCARVDEWQDRYRSREDAIEGHKEMIRNVLQELKRHPRSTRRMKVAQRRKMRIK